ncbi:transporter substrate-binding domain-containing protein [Corynebacterium halotolerans]|uniref:ABC transporter, solute binding protein n=1 Tax=Corynebacterium halotolerans YIM 70093 = DSM 44683 TaxID=1121362 RepID=M1MWX1_9CORY|nr:transporter substrate-binding domain-containing protein [Corynebacterium halotolerans]AGF72249.1 ABC transporter, solute binding protein [Corynebacterium halotolerans YIM 70093 = DSM 44683]
MRAPQLRRRATLAVVGVVTALGLASCADPVNLAAVEDTGLNLSPAQNPVRSTANPEIAAMVPEQISADGALTVGSLIHGAPPLVMMATDNATPIGVEVDLARLVADKLGLELDLELTSWDNWPLKVEANEYEAMHANIGITDERMQKFDFTPYRAAYLGFLKPADSDLRIESADDIAGLRIAVVAGTNQERVLLAWNEQLAAQGREPADLYYYVNENDMTMAVVSGRVDAFFNHFPGASYLASTREDVAVAGQISAGWPDETLVGAAMARGSGLAPAYTAAMNELIEEGTYQQVLDRWELGEEALPGVETRSLEDYGN